MAPLRRPLTSFFRSSGISSVEVFEVRGENVCLLLLKTDTLRSMQCNATRYHSLGGTGKSHVLRKVKDPFVNLHKNPDFVQGKRGGVL